ncbi:MAG TPA: thiopeptide-type bacteriocin biosynthesis protein [Trebonia sp.]|nr:thiopeptide-type bacteriocin biosynthesis protein [Trebonia sp.]
MNRFDVSVYAIRRRDGRRRPFEVRWRAAGRSRSKSFITRKLADSYRAELVRAARMGLEFDPLTGEPAEWHIPEPAIVTWYEKATAYTVMKWPSLAAHSRASVADALATVTPVLTRPGARDRPGPRELRTVLYQHAFNPARPAGPGSVAAQILGWAKQASLPVGCLSEPAVLRTALEALTFRLDGSRAAANTIIRKRVVLHGALGYAAEAGLLPDNPLDSFAWHVPQSSAALDPAVVASPEQVSALLDTVARTRPELTAFFGCLYYAALRPEEAVALRLADCNLPSSGWGMLRLAAATPRTAAAWTSDGTSYEQRGLMHRPDGAIRMVRPRRCLSACSARTTRLTAPHPTAGCSGEPAAARWWIRRHRDMVHTWEPQHLALLIRLSDPGEFGAIARELARLADELAAAGLPGDLSLASYAEHPGRYGEGPAMAAAEKVFAADTLAAIAQVTAASASGTTGQALAASSMAAVAAAFAANAQAGYRALTRCLDQGAGPLDRGVREDACRLADPVDGHAALRALPGGQDVASAWERRDQTLAAYYDALAAQRDPGTMLRTLLHEHHMRALGIDPDLERQTGRHARAAALRRLALDTRP